MTRKHCYKTITRNQPKRLLYPENWQKKKNPQNIYPASILRTIYHVDYVCDDVLANSVGLICVLYQKIQNSTPGVQCLRIYCHRVQFISMII